MFGEEALIGEIVAERNDMVGCCQEVKTPTKKEKQEEGHGSTWNGDSTKMVHRSPVAY
jgi:hypothetical protein